MTQANIETEKLAAISQVIIQINQNDNQSLEDFIQAANLTKFLDTNKIQYKIQIVTDRKTIIGE